MGGQEVTDRGGGATGGETLPSRRYLGLALRETETVQEWRAAGSRPRLTSAESALCKMPCMPFNIPWHHENHQHS